MFLFIRHHLDWLSFFSLAALFILIPSIDIEFSHWFYNESTQQWWGYDSAVATSIYGIFRYLPYLLVPVFLLTLLVSLIPGAIAKPQRSILVFLFLTLLIGPGILVHSVFKEGFDRARPKNVEQFDGHKQFSSAFEINKNCRKGCNSFVSGHAAMGFWFMAFGWALRSRAWFWGGVTVGIVLSATRIVQGGHFLSDTLFAGYVCYFSCRLLGYAILRQSRVTI